MVVHQEAKNIESGAQHDFCLGCMAGADLKFQWIGMVEYIPCYYASELHWGFYLPLGYPAGKYLLSKISKIGLGYHSVYSVVVHV
jgi:hypothetical protein